MPANIALLFDVGWEGSLAAFSISGRIRRSRSGNVAIEGRGGHAKAMRNLRHTDVGVSEQCLGSLDVVVGELWRAAPGATEATGSGETRSGALPDQTALEFRQRPEHVKNQPPLRSRGVEGFGQAAKPDTS